MPDQAPLKPAPEQKSTADQKISQFVESIWFKGLARLAMLAAFYMLSDIYTDWKEFRKTTTNDLIAMKIDIVQLQNADTAFSNRTTQEMRTVNDRITQVSKQVADVRDLIDKLRERVFPTVQQRSTP